MSILINKQTQDVLKNADVIWKSYAYDEDGRGYLHDSPKEDLVCNEHGWVNKHGKGRWMYVGDVKDPSNWRQSAINRTDVDKNGTKQVVVCGRREGKSTIFKGIDKRHLYIPPAKQDNLKTWIDLFDPKAQHQTEQLNKEILALKSLVNVQDAQLKEADRKEERLGLVISEVLQMLYAVDPEARVSLTSGQLIELLQHHNEDPFAY